jgi:hypothetical protein
MVGPRVVSGVIDHDELTAVPRCREHPRNVQRGAEIEPSVDEHAGDAGQLVDVAEESVILQPSGVAPVVSYQAGEAEAKDRVVVARVRWVAGARPDMGSLPGALVSCRLLAHGGVRVEQKPVVGLDETRVALGPRNAIARPRPLRWEEPAGVARDPLDLAARRRHHGEQHHLGDSLRMALAIRERQRRAPRAT